MKVGQWGRSHGAICDISRDSKPQRLETITIFSSEANGGRVYGLSFEYVDQKDQTIHVGPWGSDNKGNKETIPLGEIQHVYHVSGTMDAVGVTSLMFMTNTGAEYGPYGHQSGDFFSLPLDQQHQGQVLGFFGRSTDRLVALGMYVLIGTSGGMVKVGAWGPGGGTVRHHPVHNVPRHLTSITIRHSEGYDERIYGFSFEYLDMKGQTISVGTWGSATKGLATTITLGNSEYVDHINGTTDDKGVTSLHIKTSTAVEYGPYGEPAGTTFSLPMKHGDATARSFFGLANGSCLVALGAYVSTRPNPRP